MIEERKFYFVYPSPYSGAFDLLGSTRIPRPCASNNGNATQMNYFYG